jgi:hypothetical protein
MVAKSGYHHTFPERGETQLSQYCPRLTQNPVITIPSAIDAKAGYHHTIRDRRKNNLTSEWG